MLFNLQWRHNEVDNKKYAFIAPIVSVLLIVSTGFFAVFSALSQAPLKSIPVDWGWIGFFFVFIIGYFFSIILCGGRVGLTERLLLSIGLGFGLTFIDMILLGVFGNFTFFTILLTQVLLSIVLIGIAFHRGWRLTSAFDFKKGNLKTPKLSILRTTLIALVCVSGFFALYKTVILPATEWDSLAYGVNYAKILFESGNVPLIAGPSIGLEMSASYPPGVQLTAVFLYIFAGSANDFYYRLLSPIFGLLTVLVTYKFAMLLNKDRTLSVYAVSFLSIIPFFWEQFLNESYLMALTLMFTACSYFFYKAYVVSAADAKKYEIVGALFCSFAALTSYTGLLAFSIPLLYALHKKVGLKRTAGLVVFSLLLIAPWYLRNLVLLGNPVYPFMGIGKYLDPLLLSSTSQHFQQYLLVPEYLWTSVISKLGMAVIGVGIVYFTFSKRKQFDFILPYYLPFVCLAIMGLYVAFPRYLIIAAPSLMVIFTAYIGLLFSRKPKWSSAILAALLALLILGSAFMLPHINAVKPSAKEGETQSLYLSRIYEEGDAWAWINENTPENARVATFDIKDYYLKRSILHLDGNESAPLYQMKTINESIAFLNQKGVTYILSVPWASIGDKRMPPAYLWCPLTRYLGDPECLPTVFIGKNGTAVYHVGLVNETEVAQTFTQKNMVLPAKHYVFNLTIKNSAVSHDAQFYLPIPVDLRNGTLTAYVNTSKPITIQLWGGLISPAELSKKAETSVPIIDWPVQALNSSGFEEPSFTWLVDKAGYFTVRLLDKQTSLAADFNVTFDIFFANYFETVN